MHLATRHLTHHAICSPHPASTGTPDGSLHGNPTPGSGNFKLLKGFYLNTWLGTPALATENT